jgi:hypothetical protein
MTVHNLLVAASQLDRVDKLWLIQFLLVELAKDEGIKLVEEGEYPIWTPLDTYEAAQILSDVLNVNKRVCCG